MHAMIRHYQMAGSMEDLMAEVDSLYAGQLSAASTSPSDAPVRVPSGILSYQAVATGEDTLLTITTFASEEQLQLAQNGAAAIRASLAEFRVEEIDTSFGEVQISHVNEQLLARISPAGRRPTHSGHADEESP
jgi:hypothetical protein